MPRQTGGISYTPQWNFLGTGDSTTLQSYNSLNDTYSLIITEPIGDARYAPIAGGSGYVPYTGATANVVLGSFDMSAQGYAISGTGGLGYINMPYGGDDSGGSAVPTPAGGVNVYSRGNNYFGWKGTNGYSANLFTQFFTGNNAFILPNLNGKTIATIDGGQTFTSPVFVTPSSDYLKLTANIVSATTPTGSQIVLGRGVGANTFGFVGANGFSANFSAGGLTSAHTYTLPDVSGGTIALTNTDNGFITPQTMSGLTISGTAGSGIINLAQQTSGTIPTPSSALNIYAGANNTFIAKTTTGFSGSLSYNSITANRTYTLPDAQITIAGKEIDNAFTVGQSMPSSKLTTTIGSAATPASGEIVIARGQANNSFGFLGNNGFYASIYAGGFTASRSITLPDAATTLLGTDNTATVTNKTIDGSSNTITNIPLSTAITGVLPSGNGGTGRNNGSSTITLGGNLTTSGAFSTTLTSTATTSVTLPTSGTLYGTATGSITSAQLRTSLSDETGLGSVVFSAGPTLTSATFSGQITSTVGNNSTPFVASSATTGHTRWVSSNSTGISWFGTNDNASGLGTGTDNGATIVGAASNTNLNFITQATSRYAIDNNGNHNFKTGTVTVGNTVNLKNYTVATLPAGTRGDIAYVTDASAPTYLTAVVGGGAVVVPVFFDGTNWVAH